MARARIVCEHCGQEVSLSNYGKHLRRHELHPETFDTPKYRVDHEGLDCKFCGKTCKNRNSLSNHERLCKLNPDHQISSLEATASERTVWNKGLTKETSTAVQRLTDKVKQTLQVKGGGFRGHVHSEESRKKMALKAAGNTRGNRSKKGWYKGIYCGSTYELAYVIYNLDNNIPFTRCSRYYEYEYKDAIHRYFPDFELPDGTIIEIKGYHTELVDIKVAAVFDAPIKVFYLRDLKPCFEYVCKTYNVDMNSIHTLYDRSNLPG